MWAVVRKTPVLLNGGINNTSYCRFWSWDKWAEIKNEHQKNNIEF